MPTRRRYSAAYANGRFGDALEWLATQSPTFLWIPAGSQAAAHFDRAGKLAGVPQEPGVFGVGGMANPAANGAGGLKFATNAGVSGSATPFLGLALVSIDDPTSVTGAFVKIGASGDGLGFGAGGTTFEDSGSKCITLKEGLAWNPASVGSQFATGLNLVSFGYTNEGVLTQVCHTGGNGGVDAFSGWTAAGSEIYINGYSTARRSNAKVHAVAILLESLTNAAFVARRDYLYSVFAEFDRARRSAVDAWMQSGAVVVPVSAAGTRSTAMSLSAAVQQAQQLAASMSAAMQSAQSGAASVGAVVQAATTAQAQLDGAVTQSGNAIASLEAGVRAAGSAATGAGAAVQRAVSAVCALDTAVQVQRTVTASMTAQVQATSSAAVSLDSYVRVGSNLGASMGAAILRLALNALGADAAVQTSATSTAGMSAALVVALQASAAASAAVRAVAASTLGLNAQVQDGFAALASADAAVLAAAAASTSLAAAISVQRLSQASLDAVASARQSTAAVVSAYIQADATAAWPGTQRSFASRAARGAAGRSARNIIKGITP